MNRIVKQESKLSFKKPLKVKFFGEEGVDEGGVSKEFFQILISELFEPKYGTFIYNSDTRTYWFNRNSLEDQQNFKLIGILCGLAIYMGVVFFSIDFQVNIQNSE